MIEFHSNSRDSDEESGGHTSLEEPAKIDPSLRNGSDGIVSVMRQGRSKLISLQPSHEDIGKEIGNSNTSEQPKESSHSRSSLREPGKIPAPVTNRACMEDTDELIFQNERFEQLLEERFFLLFNECSREFLEKQGRRESIEEIENDDASEDVNRNREISAKESIIRNGREAFEAHLSEDSFSFLVVSGPFTSAFICAWLVLALKTVIYYLILANLIEWDTPSNRLNVPVAIQTPVIITQFFAFCISVFTQNDIISSLTLFYEGYTEDFKDVTRGMGGNKSQWVIAIAASFSDGILGLFATFVLIVNSATVLDVLLNFAAVEFISNLDESVFHLAKHGFLGRGNRIEAERVMKAVIYVRRRTRAIRFLGPIFILAVVLAFWLVIVFHQANGVYAPRALIVQFEDKIRPGLAPHSGFYILHTRPSAPPHSRFRYFEERDGGGLIKYCQREKEWSFLVNNDDPCDDTVIAAKSSEIVLLDITASTRGQWFAVRENSAYASPMENFLLALGCKEDEDCGGSDQGRCVDAKCVCMDGYAGKRCNFPIEDICRAISINTLFSNQFPAPREIATTFEWVEGVQVYNRSLYVNFETHDMILYTGVRWALTNIETGFSHLNVSNQELFKILGSSKFHASVISSIDMLSEPVRFGSAQDNALTPVDLRWFIVPGSTNLANATDLVEPETPAQLLCSVCNNSTNQCLYDNTCTKNGACECTNGASGSLCQVAPSGDGKCDEFFNNPQFNFDGGDCCEVTCVTNEYICGELEGPGDLSTVLIGFPTCRDISVLGDCPDDGKSRCYIPSSEPVLPFSTSTAIPTLSANGRILVLAEPQFDTVRVFDIEDSNWVQRGGRLEGGVNTNYGESLDIVTLPGAVAARRSGRTPIFLTIASFGNSPHIDLFSWSSSFSSWEPEDPIELLSYGICLDRPSRCRFMVSVGMGPVGSNGTILTSVLVHLEAQKENYVFTRLDDEITWTGQSLPSSDLAAVSGNGGLVALYNQNETEVGFVEYDEFQELHANYTAPLPLEFPNGLHENEIASLRVDAMQLSDFGRSFGVVFSLATINGTNHSFLAAYDVSFVSFGLLPLLVSDHPINVPFSAAQFPRGSAGPAVLLSRRRVGDDGNAEDVFTSFSLSAVSGLFEEIGNVTNKDTSRSITQASISYDGNVLAYGGRTTTEVRKMNGRCTDDEMVFHLSLTLDRQPSEIFWSLTTLATFKGVLLTNGVIRSCVFCYDDDDLFARTIVVEEFCIPKNQSNCLEFYFEDVDPPLGSNAGYEAILYDSDPESDVIIEFAFGQSFNATQRFTRASQKCERSSGNTPCGEDESQFVLALTFDDYPDEISWTLETVSDTLVLQNQSYADLVGPELVELRGSLQLEPVCVPRNTCLRFTIMDSFGDGICCFYGLGQYVGILDDVEVFQNGREEFSEKFHTFGGPNC